MKLLDLFCGAGGAAMGYYHAGFDDITGVDIVPQPRYPFRFVQADALEYLAEHGAEYDVIHASPPCQGYSIMNNLPWLAHKTYPLLILPTMEMLEGLGKPYVLENVMGARHGARGLKKRGLEAHGLKAGWLCGQMFELPFYRHRLFASNVFWLAPGHPKHRRNLHPRAEQYVYGGAVGGLPGGAAGLDVRPNHGNVYSAAEDARGIESWPGRRGEAGSGLTVRQYGRTSGPYAGKVKTTSGTSTSAPRPTTWQNGCGAQANGVGIGHAKGWRLAAEAMQISWMNRKEITQAIPSAYTEHVGKAFLQHLTAGATP